MIVIRAFLFVSLAIFLSCAASAKTFRSSFVRFELPPNWSCAQEELDWVCSPESLEDRSEALVIVVTKEVNAVDDTFDKYKEILKAPKPMRDLVGNAYTSQVKYVRDKPIKNHPWVDSLHLGSEIPGFYTRYVASIKDRIAALITYSVSETVFAKHGPALDAMIESAELIFDPKVFEEAKKSGILPSRSLMSGARREPVLESDAKADDAPSSNLDPMQVIGGLILVLGIAFYVYKKRKQ